MNVAIFGYTDKRIVLMSVLNILQAHGEVLFVTSNRHFKRYVADYSEIGHFENTLIAITTLPPEDIIPELGFEPSDFDHILYDCTNELPENIDKIIYVLSNYVTDQDREILINLVNAHVIYVVYTPLTKLKSYVPRYSFSQIRKLKRSPRREISETGDISLKEVEPFESEVEEVVDVPKHLHINSTNSFLITQKMFHDLEMAEAMQKSPEIKSKELSTILHKILGDSFYVSKSTVASLVGGYGK